MRLATQRDGSLDGRLIVVSSDLSRAVATASISPNLLDALQRWDAVKLPLSDLCDALDAGDVEGSFGFDPSRCAAPRRCRAARSGWTARPSSTTAG